MKKLVLIASILGAISTVPAWAATWEMVSLNPDNGAVMYINSEDLRATSSTDRMPIFWYKIVSPQKNETLTGRMQVDCSRRDARFSYMIRTVNGKDVRDGPTSTEWTPIIPDHPMEKLFTKACLNR